MYCADILPSFLKANCNFQTFSQREAVKSHVWSIWLRGGRKHKWPEEFKQGCAQCDYLSFFSMRAAGSGGHYYCILSVSHRQRTQKKKKKQVGLCHFNDSIASGVLYRLCSVTLQRPMWRAPTRPPAPPP